ncbi:aromatic-ring-hydroxylating dioxygenase subunit beta [soil metagenome]
MNDLTLAEAEQFIYREVRLLDERRFEEWMGLYTEDGVYWAPTQHGQKSPDDAVSLFYDDRGTMTARIKRFAHPDIHVQAPMSYTAHLVSNIELAANPSPAGEFVVHASFIMTEFRIGAPRMYSGRYEYRLRRDGAGSLRIAMKKAVLVNCDDSFTAMAVYI